MMKKINLYRISACIAVIGVVYVLIACYLYVYITKIKYEKEYMVVYPDKLGAIVNNLYQLKLTVMLMIMDNELPPFGEFEPWMLKPYRSKKIKKYGEWAPMKTSNIVISCDFRTRCVYVGFSNIHESVRKSQESMEPVIKERRYYANANGDPYAGGDTILMVSYFLTSKDIAILQADPSKYFF
ncbi:MAG: hypothetical protein LBQ58_10245 [Synergistaceae bacterium]|nr:hypothetical protein [Synergistaceae bacterium]